MQHVTVTSPFPVVGRPHVYLLPTLDNTQVRFWPISSGR